jgi:hypothetical protein
MEKLPTPLEIVQIEEGAKGLLQQAVISIVNIFSLVVFGSKKWVLVSSDNLSKPIYENTWMSAEFIIKNHGDNARKLQE